MISLSPLTATWETSPAHELERLSSLPTGLVWRAVQPGESDMTLEWTGERFVPGAGGAAISYEHVHRYLIAQRLAAGQRVLDLASGEGYGTDLLAQRAALVVGLEIDLDAVVHARATYRRDNLRFLRGDIRRAPLNPAQFDVVVCFEAIEHVSQPEFVLQEARRLLRPDGVLVISTPERKEYSDLRNFKNEFHEHEFYEDEFRGFLQPVFPCVEMLGQRVLNASAMWPLGSGDARELTATYSTGALATGDAAEGLPPPLYCVAVCGAAEARIHERGMRHLSLFVDPEQQWIDEHEQAILTRARLESQVLELKTHSDLLLSVKARQEDELTRLNAEAESLRLRIKDLYESTSWRVTRPLRAVSTRLSSPRRRGS